MATSAPADDINYKYIVFHEKVGEGGYGSVNRVTFKKRYNPYKGYKEAAAKTVFDLGDKEFQIMKQLDHRNIVKLLGFCQTGPIYIILMEYAPQGSLHDYLSDKSKPLPYKLKKKWVKESALAIEYLHKRNFLHRDIKPKNCLLFEDNLLKLCDFGLAREIDRSQTTSSAKGTYRYMAPELHRGNEHGRAVYSKPSDIYGYGMLVLEICTRKPPFDGMEWQKVVFEVGSGTLKPTLTEDCPQDLADIMQRCWNADPKERPTIGSIVKAFCEWTLEKEIHPKHQGESLQAYRVACCPNGDMVIADVRNLYILGSDGQYKVSLTSSESNRDKQIGLVYGITVSPQGYILVVDYTKYVKVFDVNGKYLHCFNGLGANEDPNTRCSPECITIDRKGQVLVVDRLRGIITTHTCPDGKLVNKVKFSIGYNLCMVVNSKSQILCHSHPRDSMYTKVIAIDYSGNRVFTFIPSIDDRVIGKEVWARGIVCDDDDNIYIAMKVGKRFTPIHYTGHIHKYSPTGAFLQCIAKGLYNPRDLSITADGLLVVANNISILIYSFKKIYGCR